jgi:magnesium transporter
VGDHSLPGKPAITLIAYGPNGVLEQTDPTDEQIREARASNPVVWVNIDSVGDADTVRRVGDLFGIHPLALEDVMSTRQRPKLDAYEGFLYIVVRQLTGEALKLKAEQVSLILGTGYLITFQERPGDLFDPVRVRIRTARGLIRGLGADYLAYAVIDILVDHYFLILERYGDAMEGIEDMLLSNPDPALLHRIHHVKKELMSVRKAVWPLREAIGMMERGGLPQVSQDIRLYLRDLYDHTIRVIETVESLRDVISGMLDVYLSSVSNRMNEVMKVLTIISTIFIPSTFLASIYGMNFVNMPELQSRAGYFVVLGIMVSVMAAMGFYARKKRWL